VSDEVLIGCAAGFAGDRYDAGAAVATAMANDGRRAFLMYETLAERTLALAQQRQRSGSGPGYLAELDEFLRPVLPICLAARIPIVGNFGAADPLGAARRVGELCRELGVGPARVAAVLGDDLLAVMARDDVALLIAADDAPVDAESIIAANAYLGASEIAAALADGADVVVTGRVADPSLALGPLLRSFGWSMADWDRLAAGTMAGHLLECGAQVTGGYFMDPGFKDVPRPAEIGYPFAEIGGDGAIVMTKPPGTGGRVSSRTVREQLLYEIHDPAAYLTPDVVLDISGARVEDLGGDRVRLTGSRGHPRPPTLKATVCYDGGWLGEGEISYAGPNAQARGRLAIGILAARLARIGGLRAHFDLIGVSSLFNDTEGTRMARTAEGDARDVRVRLAVSSDQQRDVRLALHEVEALYTTGPAGGGGVRLAVVPLLASASAYVPRERLRPSVSMVG
jgi:hypothetical protein